MLIIEKVVKLLDDYHFGVFREYVKNISVRSYYPLALLDVIDRNILVEQSSDDLCEMVYTENDEKTKKKFFQLAHYTFGLTSYLSKNYPNYLLPNINIYQKYVNQGKVERAKLLMDNLIEIAEKIEDYDSLVLVLQIEAHKEAIKHTRLATKNHKRIMEILEYQKILNDLHIKWRDNFNEKDKIKDIKENQLILDFFSKYFKSKSLKIQMISQYYYLQGLYYLKLERFYTSNVITEIQGLEKKLEKNGCIVFPFYLDLNYALSYLKLHLMIHKLDDEGIFEAASKVIQSSEEVLFWQNFTDQPKLFSISVQVSYLASRYMTSYKKDHYEMLPNEVKKQLKTLKTASQKLLNNEALEKEYIFQYIAFSTAYCGLLLLGDPKDIKQSIRQSEGILISYQQLSFQHFIDPIFTNLIIGYFCLGQYDEVDNSYRRYKKITNKKVVNPENDLTLHGFFYAAKWLETGRKQYIKKLKTTLEQTEAPNLKQTKQLLMEIVNYFEIPVL